MSPSPKAAGACGVLAGLGLAVELALWIASGWNPAVFADPAAALTFLSEGGPVLRGAVATGFVNLVFLVLFVAGLSAHLSERARTLAAATLWFGMIGITSHLLVPMSHWYGVPTFLAAAAQNVEAAQSAWTAFYIVGHQAAGGAGSLFMGLSMLTAGCAVVMKKTMPSWLGWLGVTAGTFVVLTLCAPSTPLSSVAGVLFTPALLLSIVWRIGAGIALMSRATLAQ